MTLACVRQLTLILSHSPFTGFPRLFFAGYPEHMTFGEFQHRFSILAPPESREPQPVLDEKKVGTSWKKRYI